MEEEETIMLPKNMFINLLDTHLQERILNRKELDVDMKKHHGNIVTRRTHKPEE